MVNLPCPRLSGLVLTTANTDTARFWTLTKNLYRFTPALVTENLYQHTVDEVSATALVLLRRRRRNVYSCLAYLAQWSSQHDSFLLQAHTELCRVGGVVEDQIRATNNGEVVAKGKKAEEGREKRKEERGKRKEEER